MNAYFNKIDKYKNKIKLYQQGGYLPSCSFQNTVEDDGEEGVCYMRGQDVIRVYPAELPHFRTINGNTFQRRKTYLWVILESNPIQILYSDPEPAGPRPYFACMNPNEVQPEIHHNHIAQGKDVKCAGTFTPDLDDNGHFYLFIDNESGHYVPDHECLQTNLPGNTWEPRDASLVFTQGYGYEVEVGEETADIGPPRQPGFIPQQQYYSSNSMEEN